MKALEDLKEMLEDELKKIAKKGDITPTELDSAYKVIDIIKDIGEIKKAEKESKPNYTNEGYSERGDYSRDGHSMAGGQPMMGGQSMDGGQSMRGYSMTMPMYSMYMPMGYDRMPYSRDGGSHDGGSYDGGASNAGRRGRDGDSDGQYSEDGGGSYARWHRRDSRGRYSRDGSSYEGRGEYSRHSQKERMIEKLESMMDTVSTERERQAIERCIEQLED